ncbi:MAG: hypothetical protein K9N23_13650 [Akkermansiaceae bacterium]|nr:hypothetical protein [Akkermansiaceae bacterium]MCF7732728.1 hypothetical protein [Akkermansiaceae bacterium]
MNATTLLEEDLELKQCEAEARELERKLAEARELPKKIALERDDKENTIPVFDRLEELRRTLEHEAGIATRREARNLQIAQNKSLTLILMLVVAVVALVAWGIRLMNEM